MFQVSSKYQAPRPVLDANVVFQLLSGWDPCTRLQIMTQVHDIPDMPETVCAVRMYSSNICEYPSASSMGDFMAQKSMVNGTSKGKILRLALQNQAILLNQVVVGSRCGQAFEKAVTRGVLCTAMTSFHKEP